MKGRVVCAVLCMHLLLQRIACSGAELVHDDVPHDLPALRNRESLGVPLAEVVAVRFMANAQWPQHRHRVGVVVRQGGDRIGAAGDLAAQPTWHIANIPLRTDSEPLQERRA